jgi:lipoprotein-anchoring transpeptidase ErfK/SrfK
MDDFIPSEDLSGVEQLKRSAVIATQNVARLRHQLENEPDEFTRSRLLKLRYGVTVGEEYRIHGTNQPEYIGRAISSGCIRMTNEDVIDLYGRVKIGTIVVVLAPGA